MTSDEYVRRLIEHMDKNHIETKCGFKEISERFDAMDAKLDGIKHKLNGKMDKVDLEEYANTLGLNIKRHGRA
jgi:hypothetical protein